MNTSFKKGILIFVIVWLGAWYARKTGYYNTFWFTDILLHITSGIGFGFFALGLINKERVSLKIQILLIISFAIFGSYLWELWEYFGFHLVPGKTEFYYPELGDTLGDIGSGFLGSALFSIYYFLKNLKGKKY